MNDLLIVLDVLAPKIGVRSNPLLKDAFEKDSRFTPKPIADAIEAAFGKVAYDPCAHSSSPVKAPRQVFKAAGQDGLKEEWSGQVVFVNQPYSSSSLWLRKIAVEWRAGRTGVLLCLVNSKTERRLRGAISLRPATLKNLGVPFHHRSAINSACSSTVCTASS